MTPAAPPRAPAGDAYLAHRPALFALAYRMLGSVHDAEDVTQETYVRWAGADRSGVANPAAYLTTVTARLALDRMRAAAALREVYIGPWLPEPLPTGPGGPADPAETVARRDLASFGMLVLLERLTPRERAVFVLREAFDLPYAQVAAVVDQTPATCRQLCRRARLRLAGAAADRGAAAAAPAGGRALVESFLAAARSGDLEGLTALLREDVVLTADGGGRARSALRPVRGAAKVARLMERLFARRLGTARHTVTEFNHAPAFVADGGTRRNVYVFDVAADGRVAGLYNLANPDKLRHLPQEFED